MIDAGIGWGDLLQVLTALPVSQREDAARALGYELRPVALKAEPPAVAAAPEPAPPAVDSGTADDVVVPVVAPPSAQQFWRVASDLPDPQALTEAPDWFSQGEMPGDAVFESDPNVTAPPVAPLVSGPRLVPFLRRHLARPQRSGDTDVPRLLRHLTRHEPIRRWPVRERARWPARVCIVLDTGHRLYPLDDDLRRIVTLLERLLGPRLMVLTTEQGLPQVPLDGRSAVVVLSDAGQGTGDIDAMSRWAAWGQRIARAGTRALLLAPLPGRLVRSELAQGFDLALLDDEPTPLRLVGRAGWRSVQAPAEPHDITPLRAALFGHTYVTPEVLRDLRRTLTGWGLALDVGSEQAVWQDTAVSGGATACMIRNEQREPVRAEFADEAVLSLAMRAAAVAVMWRHLQAASPFVRAEYARRLVGQFPAGHPLEAVLRAGVEAGDALAQRACVVMGRNESGEMAQSVAAYTARFGTRSLDLIDQGGDALQAAWLIAHRHELAVGRVKPPMGLRLDRLAWLLARQHETRRVAVQVLPERSTAGALQWCLRFDPVASGGSAPLVTLDAGPVAVVEVEGVGRMLGAVPGAVGGLGASRLKMQLGGRQLELEPFHRPDWAESIWFDQSEWHARLPGGRELIWTPTISNDFGADLAGVVSTTPLKKPCWWDANDRQQTLAVLPGSPGRVAWASRTGLEAGVWWAEFTIKGRRGPVTQRLCWIPPGEFLMGSPENEKGRYDDERQHPVLLTQGYWLADTACTQELWEAVMRKNPSDFKNDPQNPVENVSWNDITQEFLPHLNKLVPGLNLTLPTEAQWEYACRAGTQTRYSFGDEIDQDQVNFEGKRGKTVPVKALPENRWGLHQMHGNVWEWCQDALAAYPEGTLIDPIVHQDRKESRQRVLRGGCWISDGRHCRSAYRLAGEPVARSGDFGFRLARGLADQPDQLRQFGQPEAGGAEPPGIARSPEGEAPPPKAAETAKGNVASRLRRWLGLDPKEKP
jgi:formylglycine-generating enzyme required for sulfatase activity